MTLEELNLKIQKTEKELKNLKKEREELKKSIGFGAEKEIFYNKIKNAVDEARSNNDIESFRNIIERSWDSKLMTYSWNWPYIYRNGLSSKDICRMQIVWNEWISKSIRKVTKGCASGLINRKTGQLNLNEEEIEEVRKLLIKQIDDWCRLWAS